MNFVEGQGILGSIQFSDGNYPEYDRPYLIVHVEKDFVEVLNVSSTKGKEHKLAFVTNERLLSYNPPFLKPSFVKMDSLTRVDSKELSNFKLLNSGRTLKKEELDRIKNLL